MRPADGTGDVHTQLLGFIMCYLDDILLASRTAAEHIFHLRLVLSILREHARLSWPGRAASQVY